MSIIGNATKQTMREEYQIQRDTSVLKGIERPVSPFQTMTRLSLQTTDFDDQRDA